tara:strand:+ start:235 stop:837 length:603 start_codon:yes stop_codon:yes gene_type:complete
METRKIAMPLGIVIRRQPGSTRWAKWVWRVVAVLPGAGDADWTELRREGEIVEYHAATVPLELHRADAEAYMVSLSMTPPTVFVILRRDDDAQSPHEYVVHSATVSAYEAQDYQDSGEEIVEPVPMPEGLVAWVRSFTDVHFTAEEFKKRKRNRHFEALKEDGIGDPRIRQTADIYRTPSQTKPAQSGVGRPDKPKETLH